jgi:hypothetical protein
MGGGDKLLSSTARQGVPGWHLQAFIQGVTKPMDIILLNDVMTSQNIYISQISMFRITPI